MKPSTARFLTAFTLVSRIPVKKRFEADFSRSDFWIPALSPLVSLSAIAGFAVGMAVTGNFLIAVAASTALQYFCFNLFHFDGLIDTADAMLPVADRERRLEILKDPRIGSYGFFCGLLALALRAGAIALLAEGGFLFTGLIAGFLVAPLGGRLASVLIPLKLKPARATGLGTLMRGFSPSRIAAGSILAFLPALVYGAFTGGWLLPLLCAVSTFTASVIAAFFVGRTYAKKTGGFTGDALGAAIEIGEIATLLLMGIALRFIGGIAS